MADLRRDRPGNIREQRAAQASAHEAAGHVEEATTAYRTANAALKDKLSGGNRPGELWDSAATLSSAELLSLAKASLAVRRYKLLDAESRCDRYLRPPTNKEVRAIEAEAERLLESGQAKHLDDAVKVVTKTREMQRASAEAYMAEVRRTVRSDKDLIGTMIKLAEADEKINLHKLPTELRLIVGAEVVQEDGSVDLLDAFCGPAVH